MRVAPLELADYLKKHGAFRRGYPQPLDRQRRRAHKLRNWIQTWALIGASIGFLALTAWSFPGPDGIFWVAIAGAITLVSASQLTPELILRLYRAKPLPPNIFPEGNEIISILAERAGLENPPRLFLLASRNMNAFAVGRSGHSTIALTDGFIRGIRVRPR